MRKNAAILMIIVLLCCSIFTGNIYADICEEIYSINDNKDITHDFVLKEENAVEIYNEIIEIFTKNKRSIENYEKDIFRYSVDGLYAEDYPQYYSGAYINNSGDLFSFAKLD